jgi:hypothetical protein
MTKRFEKVRLWARRTPIYGELLNARKDSLTAALAELSATVLFSTLPIWLFPGIFSLALKDAPGFGEILRHSVSQGEFYLYSAACIGPLIYLIFKRYAEIRPVDETAESHSHASDVTFGTRIGRLTFEFPYGLIFVVVAVLICVVSALFFTFITLSHFPHPLFEINPEFLIWTASIMYVFALSCLYCASVYRLELESVGKTLPSQERDFLDKWENR